MVLRTAKKGPNAGGKFYGCSRYPNCKTTIPFESAIPDSEQVPEKEKQSLTETFFPRTLIARTRFQDNQVRFLETVAVPEDLLEGVDSEDIEEEILKAFSQWRIDFPTGQSKSTLTEKQRQIISVLEKILTRGRITLPSPQVEKEFKEIFKPPKIEPSLSFIESLVFRGYQKIRKSLWLDSKEENIFYEDILPKFLGENYKQFVLPQVEFSSLLPLYSSVNTTGRQRVDFAIFHPRLEEKIIVEIDGEQHKGHIESDKERDKHLQDHGYTVIRIQANEIQKGSGHQLSVLRSKLSAIEEKGDEDAVSSYNEIVKFIYSFKLAHQIQLILLQAIQSGFLNLEDRGLWHIVADLDEVGIFDKKEALVILKKSVADFVELLGKLSKLYSVKLNIGELSCNLFSDRTTSESASAICISFSDKITTDLPTFYVQNIYFPFHIANSSFSATPVIEGLEKPDEKDLEYFLQYLFRKPCLWEGQYDGITRAFQGKDALLLLPTGAGKSLVYQLTSLLLPGRTVVIDPIISLMEDQIGNLAMIGIDRCIAITTQLAEKDKSRAIQLFGKGEYLFAYVAPERFQTIEFRESLRTLTVDKSIALIVVDEAHCVSEWGHDFRTAYLNIGRSSRTYCESKGYVPPLLALTGTASRAVLKDVQRELQIEDFNAVITPKSFDRQELRFSVIYSTSQEKTARLKGYLGQMLPNVFNTSTSTFYQTRGKDTYSGLIFCPHVGGEFGVERVADELRKDLGISANIYSGREPKYWDPDQYRSHKHRVTKEFKWNKIPLLVCTKAFGMGIDKPNIRYTIHFGIPPSIESFYQEAGRAGRNRKIAYCCIIVSNDDPKRTEKLLNLTTKVEEIDEIIRNTQWEQHDDITRVLYFHTNAFRGIAEEKQDIEEILRQLGDITKKPKKVLPIPHKIKQKEDKYREAGKIAEKALHRLLLIGVISDYTIDSRDEFTVELSGANKEEIIETYGKYVSGFIGPKRREVEVQKARQFLAYDFNEFVPKMVELLLQFIYSYIESGRRRALKEMLICSQKTNDDDFRDYLIVYWGRGDEFSEQIRKAIEEILYADDIGISKVKEIIEDMESPREATEIRGAMARSLESYPDQPSLLMLRALSEIFSRDKNDEVAKQNFMVSISSALTNYGLSNSIVFEFATWAVSSIANGDIKLAKELIVELLKAYPNRDFARMLISQLPPNLGNIPAWFLLAQLQQQCHSLITQKGG